MSTPKAPHLFFSILVITLIVMTFPRVALSQSSSSVQEIQSQVSHQFGTEISFEVTYQTTKAVQSIDIFLRPQTVHETLTERMTLVDNQTASYEYLVASNYRIPAFTKIDYWFYFTFSDGETFESEHFSYFYDHNFSAVNGTALDWQTLTNGSYSAHWYDGEPEFPQKVLDAAQNGQEEISKYLNLVPTTSIDIYIYTNSAALREALQNTAPEWVGAHASPSRNVALVNIIPGAEETTQIERQVPHEITHILLYQRLGESYDNLPQWLHEGIASVAELYPNPNYRKYLDEAKATETLIPISELCATFPSETEQVLLAYAQSESFVRFLYTEYGSAGLEDLVTAYENGTTCENGVQTAFNQTLSQLERQWQIQTFDVLTAPDIELSEIFVTWIGLFCLISLVPLIILIRLMRPRN
ncbi:MAG: hypothetical protein JXB38_14675 [Anaerolineales bacterium]|nr:hypothetical protein [Anaerolineales bacterium]